MLHQIIFFKYLLNEYPQFFFGKKDTRYRLTYYFKETHAKYNKSKSIFLYKGFKFVWFLKLSIFLKMISCTWGIWSLNPNKLNFLSKFFLLFEVNDHQFIPICSSNCKSTFIVFWRLFFSLNLLIKILSPKYYFFIFKIPFTF